jgi:HK97 family phage major capsid protein
MADFAVDHAQIAQTGDTMFSGYLDPVLAKDYFAEAEKTSIVQKLAQKIPMGSTGVKIPHWTGDVAASWIGEGDMKPITKGDLTSQTISPAKIATIFVASAETVRANPAGYLTTMRTKVATAIAIAFDEAVLRGTDSPWDDSISDTTKTVSIADTGVAAGIQGNAYQAIAVNALKLLVDDGKKWTGTLLDNVAEPIINGSVDAQGRPLFNESTYTGLATPLREGSIVGRPTVLSDHAGDGTTVIGYLGDFSRVLWGQVGGISFDVTDQATLNLGTFAAPNFVSLWQHNLVAVRVEAEYGALVNDPEDFVELTNTTN